ncbi:hypothetical protein [uncultured Agrobacterium sp.]|uniref:hypothetical protein n=1 Tax=uncultured Agrobacterium sp. TaxID=157277 RepID=UPI0025CF4FAE|nr:hypothetical protein [uncultured Agrobacterium sp.]
MPHDPTNLPLPLAMLCGVVITGVMYAIGVALGHLSREAERRRTERQIAEIHNSIARHDAMMAEAERDYRARMGLTREGECNA